MTLRPIGKTDLRFALFPEEVDASTRDSYYQNFAKFADSAAMTSIAASSVVMDEVSTSSTAMDAVSESETAMDAVIASEDIALDRVVNTQVAMDAVSTSSTAMDAVSASSLAVQSVTGSALALWRFLSSAEVNTSFWSNATGTEAFWDHNGDLADPHWQLDADSRHGGKALFLDCDQFPSGGDYITWTVDLGSASSLTVYEKTLSERAANFEIIVNGTLEYSASNNNTSYTGRTVDVSSYGDGATLKVGLEGPDDSGRETLVSDIRLS